MMTKKPKKTKKIDVNDLPSLPLSSIYATEHHQAPTVKNHNTALVDQSVGDKSSTVFDLTCMCVHNQRVSSPCSTKHNQRVASPCSTTILAETSPNQDNTTLVHCQPLKKKIVSKRQNSNSILINVNRRLLVKFNL